VMGNGNNGISGKSKSIFCLVSCVGRVVAKSVRCEGEGEKKGMRV
jgi:hypothetical protein